MRNYTEVINKLFESKEVVTKEDVTKWLDTNDTEIYTIADDFNIMGLIALELNERGFPFTIKDVEEMALDYNDYLNDNNIKEDIINKVVTNFYNED